MPTEIESNGSISTANLLTANVQMTGQSSNSSDLDSPPSACVRQLGCLIKGGLQPR